ncbi:hypothetical protein BX285_4628 [Streptomyces sp. 1114.5]|uniref:hypothetical protein n=1 Tax=unclassified Streptomyces TaxID=2593676 RepID=UPI000BCF4655|nr:MULTISPECIES: hypothetical protein [unclassified Streptomyces]RKT20147.1 hypothetical protein BX285_4628 [Streptomyces sp. 1114.5]SOB78811.1 hypothetical protein SAMN06272789_0102 [Streptomyces sp. 1331.2]SOB86337.1 hypothetical protein SAMN06272789_6649 [Streptomyces sp. 1331.2]
MTEQQRSYWRVSDGAAVSASQAQIVWTRAAYPALVEVARRYHAVITSADLAEAVQEASGVRTRVNQRHWIGKVLSLVVLEAHRRGDPPLTALVVHAADGKVGAGYQEVLAVAGQPPLAQEMDREQHAAAARLACYRHFGADLPADGGTPALAPRLRAALQRKTAATTTRTSAHAAASVSAAAAAPRPPAICPNCFLELPATRVCDSCGQSVAP